MERWPDGNLKKKVYKIYFSTLIEKLYLYMHEWKETLTSSKKERVNLILYATKYVAINGYPPCTEEHTVCYVWAQWQCKGECNTASCLWVAKTAIHHFTVYHCCIITAPVTKLNHLNATILIFALLIHHCIMGFPST